MLQKYEKINIRTNGINLYEITNNIKDWINKINLSSGLLNISIQHTSASLLLQENADPTVLEDLKSYFLKLYIKFANLQNSSTEICSGLSLSSILSSFRK